MLTGGPGAGKSAVLAHLLSASEGAAAATGERVIAHHFCRALDKQEMAGGKLDAQSSFERTILAPLRALQAADLPDGPLLIVIDSLDESLNRTNDDRSRGTVAGILAHAVESSGFPDWLRVLTSSRPERAIVKTLSDLGMREEKIDARVEANHADVAALARARLPTSTDEPLGADRLDELVGKLATASKGNFLYAVSVLKQLRGNNKISLGDFDALPPDVEKLYAKSFLRLAPTVEDQKGLRQLLEVLVAAREPLSRAEL
jgi:broad-specificity NMP kinase